MKYINKKQKVVFITISLITIIGLYCYNNIVNKGNSVELESNISKVINEENKEIESKISNIKVHICGAVKQDGVIELEENSRVSDAIEKAGGLKENAYMNDVNLASLLEDGMKVYIPSVEDKNNNQVINNNSENKVVTNQSNGESKETVSTNNKNRKININTATQAELEGLPGIGSSTAQKIISYRKENGKFKNVEDIKKVSGIGEAKFNKLKGLIDIK